MSSNSLVVKRIRELSRIIHQYNFYYYCEDSAEDMSKLCYDEEYDALVEELELVDLGKARAYETPNKIVGHIPETANPGGIGNGWYFGHLESALNREGAIFKDLPLIPEKIRREEPVLIIVDTQETSYLYQVTTTSVERKEDLRVTESSSPVITLVTCVPRLVYDHRLIVSAHLVGSTDRQT